MSALIIDRLSAFYNYKCVLNDICMEINSNEFIGIIGPNGGGKTTLVRVLLGLKKIQSGCFNFSANIKVGYVPQKASYSDSFPISVLEAILAGSLPQRIKLNFKYSSKTLNKVYYLMKKMNIHYLKDKQINMLSGGEQQKVLIARALIAEPSFIFLDEPTANIDNSTETEIFKLLKRLNKNMTIVVISHNLARLSEYADKIAIINTKLLYFGDNKDFVKKIIYDKTINLV